MAQMQEVGVYDQNLELTAHNGNPVIHDMYKSMFDIRRSHIDCTITKKHAFTEVETEIFNSLVIAAVGLYTSWVCQQCAFRTPEYASSDAFKNRARAKMFTIAKDHVTLCRQLHENV